MPHKLARRRRALTRPAPVTILGASAACLMDASLIADTPVLAAVPVDAPAAGGPAACLNCGAERLGAY